MNPLNTQPTSSILNYFNYDCPQATIKEKFRLPRKLKKAYAKYNPYPYGYEYKQNFWDEFKERFYFRRG